MGPADECVPSAGRVTHGVKAVARHLFLVRVQRLRERPTIGSLDEVITQEAGVAQRGVRADADREAHHVDGVAEQGDRGGPARAGRHAGAHRDGEDRAGSWRTNRCARLQGFLVGNMIANLLEGKTIEAFRFEFEW